MVPCSAEHKKTGPRRFMTSNLAPNSVDSPTRRRPSRPSTRLGRCWSVIALAPSPRDTLPDGKLSLDSAGDFGWLFWVAGGLAALFVGYLLFDYLRDRVRARRRETRRRSKVERAMDVEADPPGG